MSDSPEIAPLTASFEKLPNKPRGKTSFMSRLPSLRRKKSKSPEHRQAETDRATSRKERKDSKKSKKGKAPQQMMATQFATTKFTPYYRSPQSQGNYKGPSLQSIQMVSKTSEKVAQYENRVSTLKAQEERSNPKYRPKMEREKNGCGPRVFGEEVKAKSSRFGFLGSSRNSTSSNESASSFTLANDENKAPLQSSEEKISDSAPSPSVIPSLITSKSTSPSGQPVSRLPTKLPSSSPQCATAAPLPTSSSKSSTNGTKVYGKPLLYKSVFSTEETNTPGLKPSLLLTDKQKQTNTSDQILPQTQKVMRPTAKQTGHVAASFVGDSSNSDGHRIIEVSRNEGASQHSRANKHVTIMDVQIAPVSANHVESQGICNGWTEEANIRETDRHGGKLREPDIPDARRLELDEIFTTEKDIISKNDSFTKNPKPLQKVGINASTKQSTHPGCKAEMTVANGIMGSPEKQPVLAEESLSTPSLETKNLESAADGSRLTARRNILKPRFESEVSNGASEPDFYEMDFTTSTPSNKASKPAGRVQTSSAGESPSKELLASVRYKIDHAFGGKGMSPRKVAKHVSIEEPGKEALEESYSKHEWLPGATVCQSPEKTILKTSKLSEGQLKNPKLSEIRSESIDLDFDLDSLASDDLMCDEYFIDDDDEAFLTKSAGYGDLCERGYKPRSGLRERASSFEEKIEKRGSLRKKKKQASYGSLPRVTKKKDETTTSTDTLDELNQLMGNDKLTQRLKHLQVATRGRSLSSPSTFRPPRQMSAPADEGDGVEIDYHSYQHMMTEMTGVRTMLLRLKRVIQNSETISPFDPALKSMSSPLCTPCHSEPTSPVGHYKKLPPGYTLETLYQENQELRLKVLHFESKEEKWTKRVEEKEKEVDLLKQQLETLSQQVNKERCEMAVQTELLQNTDSRVRRHQSLPPQQSPAKKEALAQQNTNGVIQPCTNTVIEQSAYTVSRPTTEPLSNERTSSRLVRPQVKHNKFSPSMTSLQTAKVQSAKFGAKTKNKSNIDTAADTLTQGVTDSQTQPRTDVVQNRLVGFTEETLVHANGGRKSPAEVSMVVQSKTQSSSAPSKSTSTPIKSSSKHSSAHSQAKELNNMKDYPAKKNTTRVPLFQTKRNKQPQVLESPLNNELSSTLTLTNNEEQTPMEDYPRQNNPTKSKIPVETQSSSGKKKSRLPKPKSYNY